MADIQEMLAISFQCYWETEAAYKNQNLPLTLAIAEIQEKPGPVREGKREVPWRSGVEGTGSRQSLMELSMCWCIEKYAMG